MTDESYYQSGQYSWLRTLVFVLTVVTPVSFLFVVSREHLVICFLAYLNIMIILAATQRFLRKRTLAAIVPVLFVPYLFFAWPVAIIYFAVFHPAQAYYKTLAGYCYMFDAGIKVQLCVLLFLMGYFSIVSLILRHESYVESRVSISFINFGYIVGIFAAGVLFFDGFTKATGMKGFVAYLGEGFYKYFNGLVFVVGTFMKRFSSVIKIVVLILIGGTVLFYTVGNNRARVVRCIAFLALGLFFFSTYSRKTKLIIAICLCLAFPVYVTVANTTRELIGTVGFEEGFAYRLEALKEWRQVTTERSATQFTFGRIFFTAGHSVIARTPGELPYRLFRPRLFIRETFESLIPGRLYYHPYYRGTDILLDYDFNIIPGKTSVEVSMIGNLWLMGGYLPVFFGGVALGLLHGLLIKILQRSWAASEMKALIYFSVLLPGVFWAPNFSLIEHWRDIVYRLALATILYLLLKLFVVEQRWEDRNIEEQ